jgi:hypothetical protein
MKHNIPGEYHDADATEIDVADANARQKKEMETHSLALASYCRGRARR